jgi:hypothetical protein
MIEYLIVDIACARPRLYGDLSLTGNGFLRQVL